MRIRVAAAALCVGLAATCGFAQAARADGSFESSDSLLNLIWRNSVQTAREMVSPPVNLDRRGCSIDIPRVLLDGVVRDRCPYIGDQAVTGKTLLVADEDVRVLRDMLAWFASAQKADGSIPASPFRDHSFVLVDYNAYWIESLYDYVLHTGDLALLRQVWPNLVRLVDGLYPDYVRAGLLVNWLGVADYAYIPRRGAVVAYYNAQYVRALGHAAALAQWNGDSGRGSNWRARAENTAAEFTSAFWDSGVGAFRDTSTDAEVHPLDGNAFAILAGLANPSQAQSALSYVDRTMKRSYGNSVADTNGWWGDNWQDGGHLRVYPFISFFEVLARYSAGADASALELIKRQWGYMAIRTPGTMWEKIELGPGNPDDSAPSFSHGWSSGAAPALTAYVLGVQPTSPGFATFTVTPRTAGLIWARGSVPTPHGAIRVAWQLVRGKLALEVIVPAGTVWENAPVETTTSDRAQGSKSVLAARALGAELSRTLAAVWRAAGGW